jgi:hypothetical protein
MSTVPRAASRPVWVPEPFLARSRTAFIWLAVSGVLGALAIVAGRRVGENDTTGVVLALIALVLLALTTVIVGLLLVVGAALRGPGDAMSAYGAGRRVEVTWASHGRERGGIEVEDVGEGKVVALGRLGDDRYGDDEPPHVTLGLGAHHLVLQGGPSAAAPTWYTLVDDNGYTVARADAALWPGAETGRATADWTVRPVRGPALVLRHRPDRASPAHVTLLDELGTAWWVRDARRAELPDELDPASAVFVVLLVDQLRRSVLAGSKVNKH